MCDVATGDFISDLDVSSLELFYGNGQCDHYLNGLSIWTVIQSQGIQTELSGGLGVGNVEKKIEDHRRQATSSAGGVARGRCHSSPESDSG